MEKKFSHLSASGEPTMVDVSTKSNCSREAVAQSIVALGPELIARLENDEIHTKKGPVFQTAIIAGIMGAKQTSTLIPLCHPIGLDSCTIDISINEQKQVLILCKTRIESKTGVEMEALTGASVAALTIYDMCKGFSHEIEILETKLLSKKGGKSEFKRT
ncbi:MAG: cyclic pyranopterin phosphate synthase [Cyclobacteriaceae bacterium]|jgi:cyclic pyranopterin phosphate synthase